MPKPTKKQINILYTTHVVINMIIFVSQTCFQSNICKVTTLTTTEKCGWSGHVEMQANHFMGLTNARGLLRR